MQVRSRNILFWAFTLAFPFLLLVVTELILGWMRAGGSYELVTRTTVNGREFYTLSREAGARYFTQRGISIPELHDDKFEVVKSPSTRRVFMLGESTMAGFPYDYNATAPDLLRDRLQQVLPQYHIEVINAGLSAVNSYTVRDFIGELADYKPDAFVVYVGHNEFYGALGVGSSEYLGKSRSVINLYITLNKFRTFRMLRDLYGRIRHLFADDPTPRQGSLMEAMVGKQAILYGSDDYVTARETFRANLTDIISVAKDRQIPIIFSTMASNIRDQRPLRAMFSPSTDPGQQDAWKHTVTRASADFDAGYFDQAKMSFRKAIAIDPLNADGHFRLAQCYEKLGAYDSAKAEFELARDNDAMRFRATGEFSDIIRDVCGKEQVPVADAERAFAAASPHGLTGANLMLEHLHPNVEGYRLLAKTFFETLMNDGAFLPRSDYDMKRDLTDEGYRELSAVTPFDLEAGSYRIHELTNGWPFKDESAPRDEFHPASFVQELAVRYVHKELAWSQGHYDLAGWYKERQQYDSAIQEYRAVAKVIPTSYVPLMNIGDLYRLKNSPAAAESTYRLGLDLQKSPFLHVRLGMLYFETGKIPDAIREFEATLSEQGGEVMDKRARSMARFFLGASYGRNGDLERAKANLRSAVDLDPDNKEAKIMLDKIP